MRIGKIASSEKYRIDKQFQNLDGGQNLERPDVERPIFRNFQIMNIKITKDEIVLLLNLFFH